MKKNPDNLRGKAHVGFSLVDVMVGMVIAMLGVIIIFQVFSVSEGIKRSTTSGGDALQNGAAALFALENSLKGAGYGFFPGASGNTLATPLGSPPAPPASYAPVWITPGPANTSDSIAITYRDPQIWDFGSIPPDPTVFNLEVIPPLLVETISVQTDCLGPGTSALLQLCSSLNTNGVITNRVIADGIVLIKAEYGTDLNNNGVIDSNEWSQTAPTLTQIQAQLGALPVSIPPPAVPAGLRLAVVARSAQPEKPSVLGGACDTTQALPSLTYPTWIGNNDAPAVTLDITNQADLVAAGDDWKCYRYKTFENTITIRW